MAGLGLKTTSLGFRSYTLSSTWQLSSNGSVQNLGVISDTFLSYLIPDPAVNPVYFKIYPEFSLFSLPLLPSFGLHYCSSLQIGFFLSSLRLLPPLNLIYFQYSSQSNVTSLLKTHHWLPASFRVKAKVFSNLQGLTQPVLSSPTVSLLRSNTCRLA